MNKNFDKMSHEDLLGYGSNWKIRATEALVDAPNFQADPKWISDRLDISIGSAEESLGWLVEKGVLLKDGDRYYSVNDRTHIGPESLNRQELFDMYQKMKSDLNGKVKKESAFSFNITLSDREMINEFYQKWKVAMDEIGRESQLKGCKDVFFMDISIAQLSTTLDKTDESLYGQFYQAAHDIRSPLSALNSIAHILRTEMENEGRAEFIREAITGVNTIAEEILDLRRAYSSTSVPTISLLLSRIDESLKSEQQNTKDDIFEVYSKGIDVKVVGHDLGLLRIIRNLIQNSRDAGATKISYQSTVLEDKVIFKISDNGKGISGENINLVGKEGFTTKSNGNGLGLFYAIQKIESWGGKLKILPLEKGLSIEIYLNIVAS